jgi:hypothetical protein
LEADEAFEAGLLGRAAFLTAFFFAIGVVLSIHPGAIDRSLRIDHQSAERSFRNAVIIVAAARDLPHQTGMFLKKRPKQVLLILCKQTF